MLPTTHLYVALRGSCGTATELLPQGGESTFGEEYQFTRHLRDNLAKELPKLNVEVLVYPKYETRGDLGECVSRFTDW